MYTVVNQAVQQHMTGKLLYFNEPVKKEGMKIKTVFICLIVYSVVLIVGQMLFPLLCLWVLLLVGYVIDAVFGRKHEVTK